ncbi:MAG: hypothetical protein ACRECX_03640 [Methyloceanibacter sp.]|uniref:hypothetical protein n=1 Tax=Methyloceanibacter sp. TaxID=1965321 RepID=UPI003D6CED4D
MAIIAFLQPFRTGFFWQQRDGAPISKSDTTYEYSINTDLGVFYVRVNGSDLDYDGDEPDGGTYTSIDVFSDAGFTTTVASYDASNPKPFDGYFSGEALGLEEADFITGSDFDDWIRGGGGADTQDGGDGSDNYFFSPGDVVAGESINDTGATGIDRIWISGDIVFEAIPVAGIEGITFDAPPGILNKATISSQQLGFQRT